jgi:hypothetical protein
VADMAVQISADVQQAVQGLARVGQGLDAVKRKALEAGQGMATLAQRARAQLPAAARAAGQVGGQAGGVLSRFGGLIGGGGGGALARLGIIAAAAGIALQVLSAHSERAARTAEMRVRAQLQLRDAQMRAVQQREQSARAGMDLAEAEQQVRGVGGQPALDALQALLSRGIERGKATQGVRTAFANSSPAAAGELLRMADILARVGVPFAQAVQGLAQSLPRETSLQDSRKMPAMARVFGQAFGIDSPRMATERFGAALYDTDARMRSAGGAAGAERIRAARRTQNQLGDQNLADFAEQFQSMFRAELAQLRTPEASGQLQVFNALQEQTSILERQLEAMGAIGRALDVANGFWRGTGRSADLRASQEVMGSTFSGSR